MQPHRIEPQIGKPNYNVGLRRFGGEDAPGAGVFHRDNNGEILHTCSTYSRGLDMLNNAYHLVDILPKGRDGEEFSYGMAETPRSV